MQVPIVRPMSKLDIEHKAIQFLRQIYPVALQRPTPFPALRLMETGVFKRHFKYEYEIDNLPDKHEGFCDFTERKIVISESTYDGASQGNPRDLYTITHEYGHVIMHASQLQNTQTNLFEKRTVVMAHRKNIPAYKDPEWQSNTFAGAVLAPMQHISALEKKGKAPRDLTAIFNISFKVAEIRFERLFEYREKGAIK